MHSLMLRADLRETCQDWDPWEAGGPCLGASKQQPELAWAVRVLALRQAGRVPLTKLLPLVVASSLCTARWL